MSRGAKRDADTRDLQVAALTSWNVVCRVQGMRIINRSMSVRVRFVAPCALVQPALLDINILPNNEHFVEIRRFFTRTLREYAHIRAHFARRGHNIARAATADTERYLCTTKLRMRSRLVYLFSQSPFGPLHDLRRNSSCVKLPYNI